MNEPRHFKLKVTSFDGTLFRLFFNSFVTPNIFKNSEQLEVIEYSAYEQLKSENAENTNALINQIKLRDDDIEQLKSKLKVAKDALQLITDDASKPIEEISGYFIGEETLDQVEKALKEIGGEI